MFVCAIHISMTSPRYDELDELLMRMRNARRRPAWRQRIFDGMSSSTALSTLRVLRAVEQSEVAGVGASVGDVAAYIAVEHSTASRMVAGVVASGLLSKSAGARDQRRCELKLTPMGRSELTKITERRHELVAQVVSDWQDSDVDMLIALLRRLAADFERATRE